MTTGDRIQETDELRDVLSALEYFIPEVLREIHSEWTYESLDGVFPLVAQKTGDREAELFGQCILIGDQTIVPIHVRLQVHPKEDNVIWFECNLGAKGPHGMVRTPYRSPSSFDKQLYSLEGQEDLIDWAFMVVFGKRGQ